MTATTLGTWDKLVAITGPAPELVVTGVLADSCVISTALPAADAGALTVVTDGCAGSTPSNNRAALDVMALYQPHVTRRTTDEVLRQLGARRPSDPPSGTASGA